MKRLFSLYTRLAVILVSVTLLVVAALWGMDGALAVRHALSGRGAVVYSRDFDFTSYTTVPRDEARAVAKAFDAWGGTLPEVYNPWTATMLAPYRSRYITVMADPVLTYRANGPNPATVKAGHKPFVVWAFGGMTQFGFGMPDDKTIPADLEKILSASMPDRAVHVVNFGQSKAFSSTEVAAFVALLRDRPAPDVAIFLDGLNDIEYGLHGFTAPVYAGRVNRAWERARQNEKFALPWFTPTESLPTRRVFKGLSYVLSGRPEEKPDPFKIPSGRAPVAVAKTMSWNYRTIRALSKTYGFKAFVFLQPLPWDHPRNGAPLSKATRRTHGVYRALNGDVSGDMAGFLFNFRNALAGIDKPYVDGIHYAEAANVRLAQRIGAVLAASSKP